MDSATLVRAVKRVVSVTEDEYEANYIIHGGYLNTTLALMGMITSPAEAPERVEGGAVDAGVTANIRIVDLSDPGNPKGIHIKPRRLHERPPLSVLHAELGVTVEVKFYDVNGIPVYFVEEPTPTEAVRYLYIYLKQRLGETGANDVQELISHARVALDDLSLRTDELLALPDARAAIYYLWRDLMDYGPLSAPMLDPHVEEVSWFAYDGPAQVVDKEVSKVYPNAEFVVTNIFIPPVLEDERRRFLLRQVALSVAARARAGLTTARPLVEARVPDPSGRGFHRLAAHLDIVSRSSALTIRKFPEIKLSLTHLIRNGTLSPLLAAYLLWQLIHRGFILVVGAMASGKTTLLQALISALPTSYKVITIEDTPELSTPAFNWHPLYTRYAPEGIEIENIDFKRLVRHSLRHRGTIVTLGEVRGEEMADLVQAAASGHGAICLPAWSVVPVRIDGVERLATMKEAVEAFKAGKRVEALGFVGGSTAWVPVRRVVETTTDEWIEVVTETGRRAVFTPDHLVPVRTRGGLKLKKAGELVVGDELIVAPPPPRPRETVKYVVAGDQYVPLDYNAGVVLGLYLLGGRVSRGSRVSLPARHQKSVEAVAGRLGLRPRWGRRRVRLRAAVFAELLERLVEAVETRTLALPRQFAAGLAEALTGAGRVRVGRRLAYHVHYALRLAGVDSVVDGEELRVLGPAAPAKTEAVAALRRVAAAGEPAYDFELAGNHLFVHDASIVSHNCTFHAYDPFSIIARMTSPPINVSEENIKLITSIVHIERTKTYARGRPELVRRVLEVYEIVDVKGRRPIHTTPFRWNPSTDTFDPPMSIGGLKKLWRRSRTVRTLGWALYLDEAPKVLLEILVLAGFLKALAINGVVDIRDVLWHLSSFYLRIDDEVEGLWRKYRDKLGGLKVDDPLETR